MRQTLELLGYEEVEFAKNGGKSGDKSLILRPSDGIGNVKVTIKTNFPINAISTKHFKRKRIISAMTCYVLSNTHPTNSTDKGCAVIEGATEFVVARENQKSPYGLYILGDHPILGGNVLHEVSYFIDPATEQIKKFEVEISVSKYSNSEKAEKFFEESEPPAPKKKTRKLKSSFETCEEVDDFEIPEPESVKPAPKKKSKAIASEEDEFI